MEKNKYPTPRGESATRAKAKYNDKAYDKFLVYVPKGRRSEIDQAAAALGFGSRNEFIVSLINEKLQAVEISIEDMASAADLAAHDVAMREYMAGETVPHDAIDWS